MKTEVPAPCYLYVIQSESGAVKIGIASNPSARIRSIQTGSSDTLAIIYTLRLANRELAQALEAAMHERYAAYQLRGEWFAVDGDEVLKDLRYTIAFARVVTSIEVLDYWADRDAYIGNPAATLGELAEASVATLSDEDQELYEVAVSLVKRLGRASVSLFERRLKIGYLRASRIFDAMEVRGVFAELGLERQKKNRPLTAHVPPITPPA